MTVMVNVFCVILAVILVMLLRTCKYQSDICRFPGTAGKVFPINNDIGDQSRKERRSITVQFSLDGCIFMWFKRINKISACVTSKPFDQFSPLPMEIALV